MKYGLVLLLWFAACTEPKTDSAVSGSALDAGRGYLQACLQGDFTTAAGYLPAADSTLQHQLMLQEMDYRTLDREGRQMKRTASLQIHAINDITPEQVQFIYSFSFSPQIKDTLVIEKKSAGWLIVSQ
jgi:hypothetical protein